MYYDTDGKLAPPPQRWTHLPDMCEPQTSAPRRWGWRGRRASAPWSTVLCLDEWAWRSSVGETSTRVTAVRARANLRCRQFQRDLRAGGPRRWSWNEGTWRGSWHPPASSCSRGACAAETGSQTSWRGTRQSKLKLGRFWKESVWKWWTLWAPIMGDLKGCSVWIPLEKLKNPAATQLFSLVLVLWRVFEWVAWMSPSKMTHRSDLFKALHISMVTRTERAIVIGGDDSNTSQRISAKSSLSSLHCMKCDWWEGETKKGFNAPRLWGGKAGV